MESGTSAPPPAHEQQQQWQPTAYPPAPSGEDKGIPMQPYPPQQPAPGYPPQAGAPYPYGQPGYGQQPVMLGQQGTYQYPPAPGVYPMGGPGVPGSNPNVVYQPQPQFVAVNDPSPAPSFTVHIILSCVVTWCCCCCFGIIAFILAMMANGYRWTQRNSATSLGRASLGFSIAGIVIGVILVIVAIVLSQSGVCAYQVMGKCYRYRSTHAWNSWTECAGHHSGNHCCYN